MIPKRIIVNLPDTEYPWAQVEVSPASAAEIQRAKLMLRSIKRYEPEHYWGLWIFYPSGSECLYLKDRYRCSRDHVSMERQPPPVRPDLWVLIDPAGVPIKPKKEDIPRRKSRKRKGRRRRTEGADRRGYAIPPMNPAEAWVFWEWHKRQEAAGKSTVFPGGVREKWIGAWKGEPVSPDDAAQAEPGWLRDLLREMAAADFGAWSALLASAPSWWSYWLRGLREDPRYAKDYQFSVEQWSTLELRDPQTCAALLLGIGSLPAVPPKPEISGPGDYDPLRDGPYRDWAKRNGIELAPELKHSEPVKFVTTREIPVRDKRGRFTGEKRSVAVPTMRIDLDSPLGKRIRIIDADRRGGVPRGALAIIETSPGRHQYVVPVQPDGSYRGKSIDDPKRAALRRETGAESIQLTDHRTGKAREVAILVTPRSRNFDLAVEFQQAFSNLASKAIA